jgi:hypothetical protein
MPANLYWYLFKNKFPSVPKDGQTDRKAIRTESCWRIWHGSAQLSKGNHGRNWEHQNCSLYLVAKDQGFDRNGHESETDQP